VVLELGIFYNVKTAWCFYCGHCSGTVAMKLAYFVTDLPTLLSDNNVVRSSNVLSLL